MFVEMDKLLNEIVKDLENADRLKKKNPIQSTVEFLKICGEFQNSFDKEMRGLFLNQFKLWMEDYSSNQRRLIGNFIFTITGEGFFQETTNGKKFTKESSELHKLPTSPQLIKDYKSVSRV